jgi:hypothetical protein
MDTRFDDLLNTVIAEKGQGIYGFFDVMFSFLYRRTDFFYEMAPGENMGFFPTQAEAIVCGYFRKYQQLHYKERVPKRNIDPKLIEQYIKKQKDNNEKKEEVKKIISNPQNEIKVENNNNNENKQEKKENVVKENNNNINVNSEKKEEKNEIKNLNENKKKDDIKPPVENKPISISTYNGDKCDDYNWSQGVNDVTIQFNLPKAISKKMLEVDMTVKHLRVKIKDMDKPLVDDDFCEKIKADDSNWTIEDGQSLIFYLEKANEVIWKSAFKGGKEIDTKTVDNSKRIDEFDSETQAALNKIVYEQNRKRNGLPTTEEEKKLAALKEAWNKPGSPFAGQPFDPSMFNLNEPIYYNTPEYEAAQRAKKEQEKK